MVSIQEIHFREAKNLHEVNAAYNLAHCVFGPNYFESADKKKHILSLEPIKHSEDVLIAIKRKEIIGMVRLLDRCLHTPIGPLKTGGLTSVCIHPKFRSIGVGKRLIDEAIIRLHLQGYALSLLFARRAVDGWYTKFGYVGIGNHVKLEALDFHQIYSFFTKRHSQLVTGVFSKWHSYYEACYNESYGNLFLSFCRSQKWWNKLEHRLWKKISNNEMVTVIIKAKPIGYFILQDKCVIELASLEKYKELVLSETIRYMQKESLSCFALPIDHFAMSYLKSINHILTQRKSWDGGHMLRLLPNVKTGELLNTLGVFPASPEIHAFYKDKNLLKHDCAKQLLLSLVGTGTSSSNSTPFKNLNFFPSLPTWSIIDEC